MPNVDHVRVGSTSYDISPSPTGTLATGTGGFSSSDVAQASATSWTNVDQITTSDNHASIFTKITQMVKNVRYLYNVLGTGFSTGSTVKNQIDGKAAANHSHKVAQLPTSSIQVNSNDYIPTSALIYSMNQTLTSLNDASNKVSLGKDIFTMHEVGGIPDCSLLNRDTSIQSIIIKMLGDNSSHDFDTSTPNTRYKVKNLGTWSSIKDVDNFLSKCNHATGYYGATIGSYVTIKDGTYNKQWIIAGFDCEYNHKVLDVDGSTSIIKDNGYGICLIPKSGLTKVRITIERPDTSTGYYGSNMNKNILPTVANNLKKVLGNHLVERNVILSSSLNNNSPYYANGCKWTTAYCTLMSVGQITGKFANNRNKYDDGEANYKLPLFNYETWSFDANLTWLRNIYDSNCFYVINASGGLEYKSTDEWSNVPYLRPLIYIR